MQLSKMQGGGLVEVLIALVLMALGLMGMLTAHSVALRMTKLSEHRNTAMWLAQDLGERVRANRGRLASADAVGAAYVINLDAAAQAQATALPDELCNRPQSACSMPQMAAADLAQWRVLVRERLPRGVVWVSYSLGTLDIWVAWVEASGEETLASTCPSGLMVNDAALRCSQWSLSL